MSYYVGSERLAKESWKRKICLDASKWERFHSGEKGYSKGEWHFLIRVWIWEHILAHLAVLFWHAQPVSKCFRRIKNSLKERWREYWKRRRKQSFYPSNLSTIRVPVLHSSDNYGKSYIGMRFKSWKIAFVAVKMRSFLRLSKKYENFTLINLQRNSSSSTTLIMHVI